MTYTNETLSSKKLMNAAKKSVDQLIEQSADMAGVLNFLKQASCDAGYLWTRDYSASVNRCS